MQNLLCPLRAADLLDSGPPGPLTLAQKGFLGFGYKTNTTGFVGWVHHIENPTLHVEGHDTCLQLFPT